MDTGVPHPRFARAGMREWAGLALLVLPTVLSTMDFGLLFTAAPSLGATLPAGGVQQVWIVAGYGVVAAGCGVTAGALGDRIGHRRLLVGCAFLFGLVSFVAAYPDSADMLTITRGALGVCGAALLPAARSLVVALFRSPRQRRLALRVWVGALLFGGAAGPVVGGVLLHYYWWGSVFLIALPVMAVVVAAAPAVLPESGHVDAAHPLDVVGLLLSLMVALAFVWGLSDLAVPGVPGAPLVSLIIGVTAGGWLVVRRRGTGSTTGSAAVLLGGAIAGGVGYLAVQFLQVVAGRSALGAGLLLLPAAGALVAGSALAPVLARTFDARQVMAGGLVLAAAGCVVLTAGTAGVVTGVALVCVGVAPTWALGGQLNRDTATFVARTGGLAGAALGVAVLGSVALLAYQGLVRIPLGVPGAAAGDSVAGATATAGELPAGLGTALLTAARAAVVDAFDTAALVACCAALVLAALTVVRGRRAATATTEPATALREAA